MNDKLVSIPVFVYNGEKFLKQQLDSLLNQSYKNIEIIVCDDASSDKSLEIIKQYSKVENLTYYTNKVNLGITKNVEKGLSMCKGDYIAICDHDDIWLHNKIEILVENIEDNLLIYSASIKIDENNNIIDSSVDTFKLSRSCSKSLIMQNCVSGHTLMFKKELLEYIIPFPKNYIHPDWWIAYVASSVAEIKYLDQVLVHYRQHTNQITKATKQKLIEPISKYISKLEQYNIGIKSRLEVLQALSSFKHNSKDINNLLKELIQETKNLKKSYINSNLQNLIIENELLPQMENKAKLKISKKLSRGLWYIRGVEFSKMFFIYLVLVSTISLIFAYLL